MKKLWNRQLQKTPVPGTIAASTFGSTGVKPITGIGFKPSLVLFFIATGNSTGNSAGGIGVMTPSVQFVDATFGTGSNNYRQSSTSQCIGWTSNGTSFSQAASYQSMDDDGFSINVTTADTSFGWRYLAFP